MKKIFATALMVFGFAAVSNSQTIITNQTMAQDGDNVRISFDVDTDQTDIPSRRKEVILPYIYSGKDTLYFDALEIYGKGRFKRERQENALDGNRDWTLSGNQIMKNDGLYNYTSSAPLKRWMKSANLGLRRQVVGCACEKNLSEANLVEGAILFEEPKVQRRQPSYTLADPARKWDLGQDQLEIIFKVSEAEIDSSVFNNEVIFGKILEAVDRIHNNPDYKIEKLQVAGFASPEGPQEFNKWLGISRAKALINYIMVNRPAYGLKESNFEIRNGEENWEGLRDALISSDYKNKDKVIAIIDNSGISNERKKDKIEEIDNGEVWNHLLEEIYPQLRTARYLTIYYNPSNDRIIEALDTANDLIGEGRYDEAFKLAKEFETDPKAINVMGVALMMQGKFEEAIPLFEKALDGGCEEAGINMNAIKAEYEFEAQQRKIIEDYLKKYE